MEAETGAEQDSELWDLDEDDAEEMADFEEAHAPVGRGWRRQCQGHAKLHPGTDL